MNSYMYETDRYEINFFNASLNYFTGKFRLIFTLDKKIHF